MTIMKGDRGMQGKRLRITLRLWTIRSSVKRARYLKEKGVFAAMGDGCSIQKRHLPLYSKLIKLGNNVHIASNVGFITHDITHMMLNCSNVANSIGTGLRFREKVGCIEIGDNVFIGSGTRILYDVKVGSNVVIGSGSIVNEDIPDNSVAAGIPAKVIGSFEDFVNKRLHETDYPQEYAPKREVVCEELADLLWKDFYKKR